MVKMEKMEKMKKKILALGFNNFYCISKIRFDLLKDLREY